MINMKLKCKYFDKVWEAEIKHKIDSHSGKAYYWVDLPIQVQHIGGMVDPKEPKAVKKLIEAIIELAKKRIAENTVYRKWEITMEE